MDMRRQSAGRSGPRLNDGPDVRCMSLTWPIEGQLEVFLSSDYL